MVALVAAALTFAAPEKLELWYREPAPVPTGWTSALPVGNGRLGGMVFGGTVLERIQLNEDTVWAGPPVEEQPKDSAAVLKRARDLWWAGDYLACEQEVRKMMAPSISPRRSARCATGARRRPSRFWCPTS